MENNQNQKADQPTKPIMVDNKAEQAKTANIAPVKPVEPAKSSNA